MTHHSASFTRLPLLLCPTSLARAEKKLENMPPRKSVTRSKRKKRDDSEKEELDADEEWSQETENAATPFRMNHFGTDPSVEPLDFSHLQLKKDHLSRPIWITPNGLIILEAFSPIYQQAYDFLVAIAEPIARPEYVHRYLLTPYSLYAAVAVSIETESIIQVLNRLCKTEIPPSVVNFIRESTATFGKAKLVLKDNVYHVESAYPDVLRKLLKNPAISDCRLIDTTDSTNTSTSGDGLTRYAAAQEIETNLNYSKIGEEIESTSNLNSSSTVEGLIRPDADEDDDLDADVIAGTTAGKSRHIAAFKVAREKVELVKKACQDMNYPLMEEYDFKNDSRNPNLACDLKPSTRIRIYQEKSLSKMFGNGRARSGIVVLPCGAGKSLTGVTAASTVKKSTMILCINNVSVKQWKEQLLQWTTIQVRSLPLSLCLSPSLALTSRLPPLLSGRSHLLIHCTI
jgi:DNA excision repair protein ERCC-3